MDISAQQIFDRVTEDIVAGDIVLFHNNGLHTAEALPLILEEYANQGLTACGVSEILLKGDSYIDINGIQRQKQLTNTR